MKIWLYFVENELWSEKQECFSIVTVLIEKPNFDIFWRRKNLKQVARRKRVTVPVRRRGETSEIDYWKRRLRSGFGITLTGNLVGCLVWNYFCYYWDSILFLTMAPLVLVDGDSSMSNPVNPALSASSTDILGCFGGEAKNGLLETIAGLWFSCRVIEAMDDELAAVELAEALVPVIGRMVLFLLPPWGLVFDAAKDFSRCLLRRISPFTSHSLSPSRTSLRTFFASTFWNAERSTITDDYFPGSQLTSLVSILNNLPKAVKLPTARFRIAVVVKHKTSRDSRRVDTSDQISIQSNDVIIVARLDESIWVRILFRLLFCPRADLLIDLISSQHGKNRRHWHCPEMRKRWSRCKKNEKKSTVRLFLSKVRSDL